MLGAIIGDIVGSRFERHNIKTKDFEFFTYRCRMTDDSMMSLAIAKALLESSGDRSRLAALAIENMREIGHLYPHCGFGGGFRKWLFSEEPEPYNSYGNGAAMRVSACGFVAHSLEEAVLLAHRVTEVTHNHPEGIKGAEATAVAIYLAKSGKSILEIRDYICQNYYTIDFTLDGIRDSYGFDVSCQGSVPQALEAFFESENFEDAIRNAISIGGDSDTIAAITGGIAEAYYGIPADLRKHALTFIEDEKLLGILLDFENAYPPLSEDQSGKKILPVKRDSDNKVYGTDRGSMIAHAVDAVDRDDDAYQADNAEITSQQLFSRIYGACGKIRGPVGREEYKTYIIPLLFFKRISDVYDEESENVVREYGDGASFFPENEIHKFSIPKGCHWKDVRSVTENVGIALVNAMTGMESANPETLSGVFSSFDDADWANKNKLSDEVLKDLIEHLSSIRIGNKDYSADVMGDSYEFLLKQFAEIAKKTGGEFYTPRAVVKLLVKILDPKAGDSVYDPSCGTGGMLIEAIHHMDNGKLSYGKIFGQEVNPSTSAIARMNLYLHGATDFKIEQGDTLRNPKFLNGGKLKTFDCVIANPPFGLSEWGAAQFATDPYGRNIWGCPTDSNADYAWLQHMVQSMNPQTGRCTVILPQGVLFHSGKEADMRRKLIESDKLECVITLVGGLFYGAGVSACILYLNNHKKAARKGRVCLIDASEIYTAKRAQNIMSDEDVETAYQLFADFKDVVGKSRVVTIEDLAKQKYTLSVNSYIERPPLPPIDPEKVRHDYKKALERVRNAEDKLFDLLKKGGYIE